MLMCMGQLMIYNGDSFEAQKQVQDQDCTVPPHTTPPFNAPTTYFEAQKQVQDQGCTAPTHTTPLFNAPTTYFKAQK